MKILLALALLVFTACGKNQIGPSDAEIESKLQDCNVADNAYPNATYRNAYELGKDTDKAVLPIAYMCKDTGDDANGTPTPAIFFNHEVQANVFDVYVYVCLNGYDGTCYQKAKAFVK